MSPERLEFHVLPPGNKLMLHYPPGAYLIEDDWAGDGEYRTLYNLFVLDHTRQHDIGGVKVGQFNMPPSGGRPNLPRTFKQLPAEFFSLGQDESYYLRVMRLNLPLREALLRGLRDVVTDQETWRSAINERVTRVSLLKALSAKTVEGQFRRILQGGLALTRYSFTYGFPTGDKTNRQMTELTFNIDPESYPPSNIHVLIGSNGVGKTRILHQIACVLTDLVPATESKLSPYLLSTDGDVPFANVVSVTFSAFDPFNPLPESKDAEKKNYSYIGLKRNTDSGRNNDVPKNLKMLGDEFALSLQECARGPRATRLRRALSILESDPVFKDADIGTLTALSDPTAVSREARRVFSTLSAGHKIVLLTMTRLVETVEEKTLVLIDEPEAHLHPPLLSAFIRSLSDLLINRNGVAVVATHSPVVLQEVPRECVWKLRRTGSVFSNGRPEIETFGENVGVLTQEVFGLEVTRAGFHTLLASAAAETDDYDALVNRFGGKLGAEARALARAHLLNRNHPPQPADDSH